VVIDLKDWIGKKNVVLVIHRGFSGSVCMTCTSQTLAISRNLKAFTDLDARVFFLYPGTREGVGKFLAAVADARGTSESLPIDVLLDTELAVVRQLNIEGELAKPTTIIIDKKGVVRFEHVAPNIADRASVPTMLDVLGRLSGK
jgi:peroxiredoxin